MPATVVRIPGRLHFPDRDRGWVLPLAALGPLRLQAGSARRRGRGGGDSTPGFSGVLPREVKGPHFVRGLVPVLRTEDSTVSGGLSWDPRPLAVLCGGGAAGTLTPWGQDHGGRPRMIWDSPAVHQPPQASVCWSRVGVRDQGDRAGRLSASWGAPPRGLTPPRRHLSPSPGCAGVPGAGHQLQGLCHSAHAAGAPGRGLQHRGAVQ